MEHPQLMVLHPQNILCKGYTYCMTQTGSTLSMDLDCQHQRNVQQLGVALQLERGQLATYKMVDRMGCMVLT